MRRDAGERNEFVRLRNCLLLAGLGEPEVEGRLFQHYEVGLREDGTLDELGRGAMGITYHALDVNLGRPSRSRSSALVIPIRPKRESVFDVRPAPPRSFGTRMWPVFFTSAKPLRANASTRWN